MDHAFQITELNIYLIKKINSLVMGLSQTARCEHESPNPTTMAKRTLTVAKPQLRIKVTDHERRAKGSYKQVVSQMKKRRKDPSRVKTHGTEFDNRTELIRTTT